MKLSKRLNKIASLIDEGTNVIDIGCDHALLDIYLTINKKNKCIASDINSNALKSAEENIKKYHLENKIELVISNGLESIKLPNNNTIIISGMGSSNIINIIKNSNYNSIDNLIVQSNNDLELLRKEITKLGFYIDKEKDVLDKGKYYIIIKFKKGFKKYNQFEYYYGPMIKSKEYNEYLIKKNNYIISCLPLKKINKKIKLKRINKKLTKLILYNYKFEKL